ncbi:MAG: hypothetical protein WC551_06865 [Patescibacteria group bacterium]
MSKLTHDGQLFLEILRARKAEIEAETKARLEAEALTWVKERVAKLGVELKTGGMGVGLCILSLTSSALEEGDKLKITALNTALGIDIMSMAVVKEQHGARDWAVVITVEELMELLETAACD